nr:N-acetylglucosamine-6-phosphate deacetylase [Atopococcus tabaci]
MLFYSERIYTPEGFRTGYLKVEDGKIAGIVEERGSQDVIDYTDKMIVPGFIDVHIHGWATGSFIHQGDKRSLENMSEDLVHMGVTSYLATTGTDSLEKLKKQVSEADAFIEEWQPEKGAQVIGVHLEGPFINEEYKGMQKAEYCLPPSVEVVDTLLTEGKEGIVKLMTLAPELPGAREVIHYLHQKGIQVSVGHSAAEFEDIQQLKKYGLGGFTHTFSGMRGMHHRRLAVAGAAMYFDDMYAEFGKQTGLTVKPEAFAIVYKIKGPDKVFLTTDCTGLAQAEEATYHYIRQATFEPEGKNEVKVTHDDGRVERFDKSDYDSVKDIELGFLSSVQNVVKNIDASVGEIVKMASENPAKYIGVYDQKGSIERGKDADFIVVDGDWKLYDTYIQGVKQPVNQEKNV